MKALYQFTIIAQSLQTIIRFGLFVFLKSECI